MRFGSHDQNRNGPAPDPLPTVRGALTISRYWRKAAVVKKIDPTKKVIASVA